MVNNINAPLNIILNGVFNDFSKLEKIGVRRLSGGSSLARYILGKTVQQAEHLYEGGVEELLNTDFSYAEANEYFNFA